MILVTGGTGTLGRAVVNRLDAAGTPARVLSRKSGTGLTTGDLVSGAGIRSALDGVDTVLHLATDGRRDVAAASMLFDAARKAGTKHLIYISIVGVDRVPLPYYRQKLAVEALLAESGLPHTILRATQFHDLVATLFGAQRRLPVLFVPSIPIQPIDVGEVADRLVELAGADAAGRVPDIGGPEVRSLRGLASAYLTSIGRRRLVLPLRLPGKTFRAYRAGHHTTPQNAVGRVTFEQYLERKRAEGPGRR